MAVALQSVTGSPHGSASLRPGQLKSKRNMPPPVKNAASRKEQSGRRVIFGIEVERELAFKRWDIGCSHIKKVTLKNVTFQAQKLQFKAPSSEVFRTLYPKVISLSPGTSFVIPVTFRPVSLEKHEDALVFQTSDGNGFEVALRGLLPEFKVTAPPSLNFGVGATHDRLNKIFELVNQSELETPFLWQSVAPFEFSPQKGSLQPYETVEICVDFMPNDAQRYTLDAVLLYGDKYQCSSKLRLEGIAKYPQVMFSIDDRPLSEVTTVDGKLIVDFGKVAFGERCDRRIKLMNPSTVGATVDVTRLDRIHPIDQVFECPVQHRAIPADSVRNIDLRYSPKLPWTTSVEYFHVRVSNKCGNLVVKCIGESLGPQVTTSCKLINFQQLMAGEQATHPLQVENKGDTPVHYSIDIDADTSVFHLDKPNGVIDKKSRIQLVVTFRPSLPISYHRRLTLLVADQEPLFIDLLGTCHDIYLRPVILQSQHLRLFQQRNERGIGYYAPEQLDQFLRAGKLKISDEDDSLFVPEAEEWEGECDPCEQLPPWKEYFFGDGHGDVVYSTPHVALEVTHLDFGRVDFTKDGGEFRPVCLRNNTRGVVIFNWTPPPDPSKRRHFTVEPKSVEVPANSSATLNVSFQPDEINRIYSMELEGFAYFKSQRDFQIVNERTLAPPFCLTLKCIGHTFKDAEKAFNPEFEFDRSQLVFPSVNVDEMFFRSVSMVNTADNPIYYQVKDLNAPFAVKPACGVVQAGKCVIFSVKCVPHKIDQFESSLNLLMNERDDLEEWINESEEELNARGAPYRTFMPRIPLLGSADQASIFLENKRELYFPPTNIGNSLSRSYPIKNTSRVPLLFEWKIHHTQSGLLSVEPASGRLEPNESQAQTWTFSPKGDGKILLKPILLTQGVSRSGALMDTSTTPLRVIGQGSQGSISAVEPYIDFGTMVVGTSAVRPITLLNQSDCAVYYQLVSTVETDGPYDENEVSQDPLTLEISQVEGCIQARCKQQIRATVRPMRRVSYQYKLAYNLMTNPDENGDCIPLTDEPQHLCHLLSTGVYPEISVTDVQGWGSARRLKKRLLHEYFSVDALNECLHADPTSAELIYTVATRQSFCRTPHVMTRAILEFNFGAAPVDSEDSCVHLLFENKGNVTTEFHFLMPEELQLELEYWAETGEYTDEELHQLKVQSRRLFQIHPAKAELPPGSSVVVQLTYSHILPSTDRLPVLMKVNKGREILLNFTGVTTEPGRDYLHFHRSMHTFAPAPIGETNPAVQVYDLYNGGDKTLRFEIDTSGLVESRLANYDYQVLECLTTSGEIPAGRSFELQFKFCPIEARTYNFEVPIQIVDGETAVITFCGVGFDKKALGDNVPVGGASEQLKVASRQAIPLQDQLAILSEERLSFANVPVLSRNRRIVFLNNTSLERPVQFQWHVTHRSHSQIVTVSPPSGRLEPGESILCQLTLVPDECPRFYDLDLICEVYDLVRLEQWTEDLRAWQDEIRRRQEEFTITEKDVEAEKLQGRKKQVAASKDKKSKSGSNSSSSKYRKDLSEEELQRKPMKPAPFLLHLGVTGQSYNIQDFQNQFPELWDASCMDRTLVQAQRRQGASDSSRSGELQPLPAEEYEGRIVELAVSNVLHSLLGDADLIAAIRGVQDEPVPYYRQLPQALLGCGSDGATCEAASEADSQLSPTAVENATASEQQAAARGSASSFSLPGSEPASSRVTVRSVKNSSATDGFGRETEELQKEKAVKSPQFATLCEAVLENIVVNIMAEANQGEFDVTARPRLIALPSRRKSRTPQSRQQ